MSTERLDDNTNNNNDGGTQRIDDGGGTQRLDDGGGTQRLDGGGGTQRLDGGDSGRRPDDIDESGTAEIASQAEQDKREAVVEDGGKKTGRAFKPGQVVELNMNDYTVDSEICSSSGEAIVYKISKDGKPYVLKYYRLGYPPADEMKGWKSVLTALKDNPSNRIVKLFEFNKHFDQYYEIMEYAEGGTLNDYLKQNGAIKDIAKLKDIVGQIAEGLEQLHGKLRIIYQDLKPENIYFRDKEKKSIILADFGISSVMMPDKDMAEVTANVTKEYAAPDLARKGTEKKVIATPKVDYFALGITLIHFWLGKRPFQDEKQATVDYEIQNRSLKLPDDMPADLKTLIYGLIDPTPKTRWGNLHIKKWIAGESLQVDLSAGIKYEKQMFNATESYSNPQELAVLLEKDTNRGIELLYGKVIAKWLENAGDHYSVLKINEITETITEDKSKIVGLYASLFALNPDKPFVSKAKKVCNTDPEIAQALMDESQHYMTALKNRNDFFYLYLQATGGNTGKLFADQFHKYFTEYSPKRALTLIYFLLQDDDGAGITIGSKTYHNPDEVAAETDAGQISLIKKALQEDDSFLLVWLSNYFSEFLSSTEKFQSLPAAEEFFLLSRFPFLSYKELIPNWQETALDDLILLVQNNPGRSDLFETYEKQGLPFDGKSRNLEWHPTVIGYFSTFFKEIIPDENTDNGLELARFLHARGASVNEKCGDNSTPLVNAILKRNLPLVKLLLELGANPNDNVDYAPILWAMFQNGDGESQDLRIELAGLLVDHKANVNVDHEDYTPLLQAILFTTPNKVAFISKLISAGANINRLDEDGLTPLSQACSCYAKQKKEGEETKYSLEVVELLLKKGAKIDVLNKKGYWAPLMRAVDADSADLVKLLLKYGSKKDFADDDGDTAFIYAKKDKNEVMARLVDPGSDLGKKAFLFGLGRVVLVILSLANIFLTMDVLARVVLSFGFEGNALLGVSALCAHLLTAYTFIVLYGLREYLTILRGTFNFVGSGILYIFGIPVFFSLAIAILQGLTKLLPENITTAMLIPVNIMTRPSSSAGVLITYLLVLGVFMAAIIFFSKFTYKFDKVWRLYKSYK
jgi:serine/threonine protein kinase/ankyrin repeat protein